MAMAAIKESKERMAEHSSLVDGESRLLELLRRVGREEPGTVGFGRPRQGPVRRAALALIASLPEGAEAPVTAARDGGADAVIIPLAAGATAVVPATAGAPALLAGIVTSGTRITPADLDRWQEAAIDAVAVRPADALAACFSSRRPGLLAVLDQHLPLDGLRATAGLAVEGFVLHDTQEEGRLSGDDLLWLTLAAGLVRGPALLLSARVVAEDLEALVAAGLCGIAVRFPVEVNAEQVQQSVAALRGAIDHLDPRLRLGRRERAGIGPVTIPATTGQAEQ